MVTMGPIEYVCIDGWMKFSFTIVLIDSATSVRIYIIRVHCNHLLWPQHSVLDGLNMHIKRIYGLE